MAENVLQLLCFKIDNSRSFRYLNIDLGLSGGEINIVAPLFLGADLLSETHVHQSNYCRIHARYAKKRLATKLLFPAEASIKGITNCQNGAWFYSIQGVFQLVFELQSRQVQLKVVNTLEGMWKNENGNPKLPKKILLTFKQLHCGLLEPHDHVMLSQMFAKCDLRTSQTDINNSSSPIVDSTSDTYNTCEMKNISDFVVTAMDDDDDGGGGGRDATNDDMIATCVADSFWCFSNELLNKTQTFLHHCHLEERYLTTSLIAFLKLVKSESKDRNDDIFASFLEVISNYSSLITDPTKLKSFCSTWGIDKKQNALLCLICEWLGKNMNLFSDSIAEKVQKFKMEHFNDLGNLPPPQSVIVEVFPECMRLLIGYWIGLYGMREPLTTTTTTTDPLPATEETNSVNHSGRKSRFSAASQGNRADHSYSSSFESVPCGSIKDDSCVLTGGKTQGGFQSNNRDDHNYYSSSIPIISSSSSSNCAENQHPRDDHTYVASSAQQESDESPAIPSSNLREDHTYVSVKERKSKISVPCSVVGTASVGAGSPSMEIGTKDDHDYDVPHAKRFKPSQVTAKGAPYAVVLDPTKHSFVQLILEFLNNVLISGVAHVVYTRLIQSC